MTKDDSRNLGDIDISVIERETKDIVIFILDQLEEYVGEHNSKSLSIFNAFLNLLIMHIDVTCTSVDDVRQLADKIKGTLLDLAIGSGKKF